MVESLVVRFARSSGVAISCECCGCDVWFGGAKGGRLIVARRRLAEGGMR